MIRIVVEITEERGVLKTSFEAQDVGRFTKAEEATCVVIFESIQRVAGETTSVTDPAGLLQQLKPNN